MKVSERDLRRARAYLKAGKCVEAQVAGTFALSAASREFQLALGTAGRNKAASLARRAGRFLRDEMIDSGCIKRRK